MDGLDKKIIGKVFIKMFYVGEREREAPDPGAVHCWRDDLFLIFRNICRSALINIIEMNFLLPASQQVKFV